jgi:hypothetical protein
MTKCFPFQQGVRVALLALALLFPATAVLAHGHAQVGDYELVIGFMNEPAYQGEPNGLELRVTNTKTGQPVSGLEETLQVEVIYGASRKALLLEPAFGAEGTYTADLLPTAAGDYTWHLFGSIDGTAVDVSMTSSPDTFASVRSKAEVAFPGEVVDAAALQEEAASARQMARVGLIAGLTGAILGLAGLLAGLSANRSRQRREAAGKPAALDR